MKMRKFLFVLMGFLCLFSAKAAEIPRSEYPRPQFERKEWRNLNGQWSYVFDFVGSGHERGYQSAPKFGGQITVPFCPESKLSGVGHTDFINNIWYQREIEIPQNWDGKNISLNFGAVYFNAEIYLDGRLAGRHFGGTSSFSIDITGLAKPGKKHNLVVFASSDVRNTRQTAGKQCLQYGSSGCNYTRTTGIWQTVWMEAFAPAALQSVQMIPDIDQKQLVVHPRFHKESDNKLKVTVKDNGKTVSEKTVSASNYSVVVLPFKTVKTWSPESPHLYDVIFQVMDHNGQVTDEVTSYVGMRKIHIDGNLIYLNNAPYYQRLVLDQGFYPDGVWTAPTDEALKQDIQMSKEAGFNGARLHQKVFEERFYYWADKLGYITWGEASSWGMDANNPEVHRNFLSEWAEIVVRDRNHPSLLIWTPLNEQWWPDKKEYPRFVSDLYDLTRNLDVTRPVNDASGGAHVKTDIWTVHNYGQDPKVLKDTLYNNGKYFQTPSWVQGVPAANIGFNGLRDNLEYHYPVYDYKMPYLIDEVGGIKWVKDQERQQANSSTLSWGYGEAPKTMEEFYTRLEGQIDAILESNAFIWGYCYTQLTDVEQEQNGIFYYDRTPKFNMKRIHAIFSKSPQAPAQNKK